MTIRLLFTENVFQAQTSDKCPVRYQFTSEENRTTYLKYVCSSKLQNNHELLDLELPLSPLPMTPGPTHISITSLISATSFFF